MKMTPKKAFAIKLLATYEKGTCALTMLKEHENELKENGFITRNKSNQLSVNSLNATLASLCESSINNEKENIFATKKHNGIIVNEKGLTLYIINDNGLKQLENK